MCVVARWTCWPFPIVSMCLPSHSIISFLGSMATAVSRDFLNRSKSRSRCDSLGLALCVLFFPRQPRFAGYPCCANNDHAKDKNVCPTGQSPLLSCRCTYTIASAFTRVRHPDASIYPARTCGWNSGIHSFQSLQNVMSAQAT